MGQQQLLLLVLGVVIVGLAVVVGIQSFTENRQKAKVDTYTAMGVEMAGDIIAWYMKPTAQGGGGQQAGSFANLTVAKLGYTPNGPTQSGSWGFRTGTVGNGVQRFVTVGQSGTHPFLHIHDDPTATGMVRVEVHVFGPFQGCVVTRNDRYGDATWSDGLESTVIPSNPNPTACSW